ncbi:MAG: DUF1700 domain-containing protein [Candidatus Fimimonas sp.]
MTKFEWERQLKKGLSGLPVAEQQRVMDYYGELFSDKIDAGMKEEEIIAEFGNPFEVANKILVDFYSEGKSSPETDEFIFSEPETGKEDDFADKKSTKKDESTKKDGSVGKKSSHSAGGFVTLLCVLVFFVAGAFWGKWHPAWMVFLLIPVITSLIEAVERRNAKIFCYPVFVAFLFLLFGFYGKMWHPMWVLFLTVPLYYTVAGYLSKNESKSSESDETREEKKSEEATKREKKGGRTGGSIFAGILATIILVSALIIVWSTVVSLFVAGIGLLVGGSVATVVAVIGFVTATPSAAFSLGCALVALGLGFLLTFGMKSIFGFCAKMTKQFAKTISSCFGKE